jgi:hypothetical protein
MSYGKDISFETVDQTDQLITYAKFCNDPELLKFWKKHSTNKEIGAHELKFR